MEEAPPVQVDVPPSPDLGDFSTDLAIALARQARQSPARVAEILAAHLDAPSGLVERVEATASGFLNFRLRPDWLHQVVREIRQLGADFGKNPDLGQGASVQVEFVSAYPTGPLTVAHGRGAALGDTLANVLEWSGFRVSREFYVNDAGGHMERFGRSLEARYLQAAGQAGAQMPLDGYSDPSLAALAQALHEEVGDAWVSLLPEARLETLTRSGRDAIVRRQQETLARFGVRLDEWYSEQALHESGQVGETLDLLRRTGFAYETEGSLWLASRRLGDEEDRPLLRSNGRPTYLAGDLAYHREKFRRGFSRVVDVWGADHLGYVKRTKAGLQALGCAPEALEILIFGPVSLKIEGMVVESGSQRGNNRFLDEVIEEVGGDTARFFYLTRPAGSPLDYDLDLARQRAAENPAWRLQQARARAQALLEEFRPGAVEPSAVPQAGTSGGDADLQSLDHPSEQALMRRLADFPDEVRAAARERDPYRLTRYAGEATAAFETFLQDCPLSGEAADADEARLALVHASSIVLRNVLAVLGMSAPERVS